MIELSPAERRKRLRLRHRRAKQAIRLDASHYSAERARAGRYWAFVASLDREIAEGKPSK